jgi:iron complex outermembrane recepter protein
MTAGMAGEVERRRSVGMRTRMHQRIAGFLAIAIMLAAAPAVAEEQAPRAGALELRVIDAETRAPISAATVRVPGHPTTRTTTAAGSVQLDELGAGPLTITVERSGYSPAEVSLELGAGETLELEVELRRAQGRLDGIVVTVIGRNGGVRDVYHPTTTMSGDDLQRSLSSSVPATLEALPGFAVQYNGPGASNPTVRGMPGDRVLMLEDGHRTGDIYWTASDHGVMVEPISAERVEVLRGPASLLYGSNALGGVVNVVRNDVPTTRPDRVEGILAGQFESVNTGLSSGAVVRGPAGPLAVYGEATGRLAGDSQTPAGTLDQTGMRAMNAAAGASWLPDWGILGASARYYDNEYGVPGEFDGELIPGGHVGGVTIRATRLTSRLLGGYHGDLGLFDGVEIRSNITRYLHDEVEGVIGGQDVLGARFDQTSTDTHLVLHRDPLHDTESAVQVGGALGLSLQTRDLFAGGSSPGTRSGRERAAGAVGFGELGFSPLRIIAGLRYDFRHVTTTNLEPLEVRTRERTIVKPVEPRSFDAVSASVATMWDVMEGFTLGATLARSFRNPTIEELYSEGPHLADFSFDIGSPDLGPEIGLGADVFVKTHLSRLKLEVAGYYNRVDGYLYYNPTGETVRVIREGSAPRETPVFEARGDDARFVGAEGRVQWDVGAGVHLDATASYTRAARRASGDPLPFIPPLSGRLQARYEQGPFFGSLGADLSAAQNRVPRPVQVGDILEEPQQPTAGYALVNAGLGWRREGAFADHSIMLYVRNATNRTWRSHMSRIKDVAPQPGRNIQLSYRAFF